MCSIRTPRTILFAPTVCGTMGIALMTATGIPARSSSFVIVAPQRLQLPQVGTMMTAPTPASSNSSTISRPNCLALPIEVWLPTVEM